MSLEGGYKLKEIQANSKHACFLVSGEWSHKNTEDEFNCRYVNVTTLAVKQIYTIPALV